MMGCRSNPIAMHGPGPRIPANGRCVRLDCRIKSGNDGYVLDIARHFSRR